MNFESFLICKETDFLGRNLQDIWKLSDKEIEQTHDFVQVVFPTNKPSMAVSHGFYLDSETLIEQIKNNPEAKKNIIKSAKWFLSFLERNTYWNQKYNHNQLRITRVIESLRLLVSSEEAEKFYRSVLELIEDDNKVNFDTLLFWKNALNLNN